MPIDITPEGQSLLKVCGVPGSVFMQRAIDLKDAVGMIESTTLTGRPKIIKKEKQIEVFKNTLNRVIDAPYVYCISSIGNDLQSKFVAAYMLNRALRHFAGMRNHVNLNAPAWHTLYGSYSDDYRDIARKVRKGRKPAVIVLSNVVANSSEVKVEKLRDLLELFSDVPRIVPISGVDPFTFFRERLYYPLTAGLNLTRGNTTIGRAGRPGMKRTTAEPDRDVDPSDEQQDNTIVKPKKRTKVTSRTSKI